MVMFMYTVKNIENTIIINKSKFITNIFSVDTEEEINKHLNDIKNKYKDATHHCYAYIVDNIKRFNDDNEPNGTAGKPILDSLEKNNLNHVLCIVTRYFGGIKLGAGGLLRAYSNSCSEAIKNTDKLELVDGYEAIISFNYNKVNEIDALLSNYQIKKKIFNDIITYDAYIDDDIMDLLNSVAKVDIIKKIIIRK